MAFNNSILIGAIIVCALLSVAGFSGSENQAAPPRLERDSAVAPPAQPLKLAATVEQNEVTIGEWIVITLTFTNTTADKMDIIKPMLDIDSVSFLIKPAGIKKFVHSAITPSAYEHNPGQLDRISLAAGAQVQEAFKLPAATLGLWEITAYYQGSNKLFSAEPLKITIVPPKSDKPEKPTDGELIAKIETSKGTMKCRFFFNDAPNTVLSFLRQSKKGFYDNLTFHRIMKGFMIQGGDPNGNGSGGPGYCIKGEFNAHRHLRGTLSMARSSQNPPIPLDNDSAGCQFFICHDAAPKLDNQYTAFGELVEGTDVLDTIANIQTGPNPGNPKEMSKPMENVFIKSISLEFREMPSNK